MKGTESEGTIVIILAFNCQGNLWTVSMWYTGIVNEWIRVHYKTLETVVVAPSNLGLLSVHPFSGLVVSNWIEETWVSSIQWKPHRMLILCLDKYGRLVALAKGDTGFGVYWSHMETPGQ